MDSAMGFLGFRRKDGSCGVRNHVVVMSSVSCANGVVQAIGRAFPEVKTITHTEGCGRAGEDLAMAIRTLSGLGRNGNVAGVLVMGLGCESIKAKDLADEIGSAGRLVTPLSIQDAGGTVKATAAGIEIVKDMIRQAKAQKREECPWSKLTMGLECGGSDALSGITANCLVGAVTDWLVERGATVILSETTEMIGTEEILRNRAADPALGQKVFDLIVNQRKKVEEILGPLASFVISPGNMEGGLSSITEKSMGCIIKGGTTPIREVVAYGASPSKKGLVIMDTPGSDIFSLTGMAAGGAQLILFTTGRGTPVGFPTVPVIKVASNPQVFERMNDDMDVNAGTLIDGASLDEARDDFAVLLKEVAEGKNTKAEINRQDVLSLYTTGPAF
jgi:altronate dehydratase large subunit